MPKVFTKRLFNQRGITLIELIAVILIIGIIAAVGVPVVFNQIQGADAAALAANIDVVNGAVERYALLNGDYPQYADAGTGLDGTAKDPATLITLLKQAEKSTDPKFVGGPYLRADFAFKDETKVKLKQTGTDVIGLEEN